MLSSCVLAIKLQLLCAQHFPQMGDSSLYWTEEASLTFGSQRYIDILELNIRIN